jgi:hypothetical protein
VRAALVDLGLGESARPEQLAPADYPRLAAAIQWQAPDR